MEIELFNVTSGPNKTCLALAFFGGEPVAFQTSEFGVVAVMIRSIQYEDGSGESWNLEGCVQGVDRGRLQHGDQVKVYYHSGRKSGTISPVREAVPA